MPLLWLIQEQELYLTASQKLGGSWAPNREEAWYIGPSMEHYRCVNCYFPNTKTTRDVDTVTFFPTTVPFPKVNLEAFLRQAASDIVSLLQNPPSTTTPSLPAGDDIQNALLQLATIIHRTDDLTSPIIQQSTVLQSPPRMDKNLNSQSTPRVVDKLNNSHITIKAKWKRQLVQQSRYNLRSTSNYKDTNFKNLAARTLLAQHVFTTPQISHIYDDTGRRLQLKQLLSGNNKHIWSKAMSMEIGRLAQGNDYEVTPTDTIDFIPYALVPFGAKVTYASFIADYRPLKPEPNRIRCVAGGDKLDYFGDASSPTTTLAETKLLFNSVISDANKGARFMTVDLKDHFLASPMRKPQYMRMRWDQIPEDIKHCYNLHQMLHNNYIYIKIKKGMYGLKEAAILAYNKLLHHLTPRGYYPIPGTAGLWRHKTKKIIFCLCVDDFGIKYFNKDDLRHFQDSLKDHFKSHTDWKGENYIGLDLNWNYSQGYVDISMPNYVDKILH